MNPLVALSHMKPSKGSWLMRLQMVISFRVSSSNTVQARMKTEKNIQPPKQLWTLVWNHGSFSVLVLWRACWKLQFQDTTTKFGITNQYCACVSKGSFFWYLTLQIIEGKVQIQQERSLCRSFGICPDKLFCERSKAEDHSKKPKKKVWFLERDSLEGK